MLVLLIISYAIFMVQQVPARSVIQWLPSDLLQRNNIRLIDVNGTLWRGRVAQLRLNGLALSNLSWQLHALPVLWGNVSLAFKFRQSNAFGKGELTSGFSGETLTISSVNGSFPASHLMPLFYGYPIALAGQVSTTIKQARIQRGQQLEIEGEMLWREAALSAPQYLLFGDLKVSMQPQEQGTLLTVRDQGGPLQLQGNITVKGDGSYDTRMTVTARSSASKALADSIGILGPRDDQGNVQIRYRGKLPNW